MLHMKQFWQMLATVSDDYTNLTNQGIKPQTSRSRGEGLKIQRQENSNAKFLVVASKLKNSANFAKIYARLAKLISFEEHYTQNLASCRMTS